MTNSKENIDTREIAEEIIENSDRIVEYGVAPSGQYFKSHTKKLHEQGHYYSCYSYIKFLNEDDKIMVMRAAHRNLLKLLVSLDDDGVIDIGEARGIHYDNQCSKCHGKGFIRGYEHVQNGVCFKCGGTGIS